jgi:hypothetical protein
MEKIQIYLNSKRANKYINDQTSDCVFFLPHINVSKTKNITVTVLNAQIPSSFYNVNSNNDKLVYNINGGATQTVNLVHSNYNINTLKAHIISLIGSNFSITYSSASNKLTFENSLHDFEFKGSSTCFELLGFSSFDHSSEIKILISDNVVNLFTVRNLQIASDNFILNNIDSYNPNNSNILASIPVNTSYNGIISYSNIHDVYSEINNTRNLTNLHIKITDQDGDIIELNKAHWSLTLLLTIK